MAIINGVLLLGIGIGLGYAVAAVRGQGQRIRECSDCGYVRAAGDELDEEMESELPPRVQRAIARAATAADDPVDGPRVWVELDVIGQIESGNDDAAVGAAGERGRYQITEGAWKDTILHLRYQRGMRLAWPWATAAHEPDRARVIAGHYVNEVLPRYLTAARLDGNDSTGPVPDSLHARVAAYNAGAKRVRQAYARWQADAGTSRPWISYLPASTQRYLSSYQATSAEQITNHKS